MTETTTILAVPDACGEHCRRSIEADLREQAGVEAVRVDVRGRVVRVSHEVDAVAVSAVVERLERSGYPVAGNSEEAKR